jgi:hypothetical protein
VAATLNVASDATNSLAYISLARLSYAFKNVTYRVSSADNSHVTLKGLLVSVLPHITTCDRERSASPVGDFALVRWDISLVIGDSFLDILDPDLQGAITFRPGTG